MHHDIIANPPVQCEFPFELITDCTSSLCSHRSSRRSCFQHLLYHFLPWHQTTPHLNESWQAQNEFCLARGCIEQWLHGTFTTAPSPGVYLRSCEACHVALSPLNVQSCRIFGHLDKFLFTYWKRPPSLHWATPIYNVKMVNTITLAQSCVSEFILKTSIQMYPRVTWFKGISVYQINAKMYSVQ